MEKKIFLTVDGSERNREAVSELGSLFKDQPECHFMLFHCAEQYSSLFVEVGRGRGDKAIRRARNALLDIGFPEDRIEQKVKNDSYDPTHDILKEAKNQGIWTIALARKGQSNLEKFLLGSVSNKVAHYGDLLTVWVVDTPLHKSQEVLIAVKGNEDCRMLAKYAGEYFGSILGLKFTLLHLIPPMPPAFWDDGHILAPEERDKRDAQVAQWRSGYALEAEGYLSEGRKIMVESGVPLENVEVSVKETVEGIARDLLNMIAAKPYRIAVIGKNSFHGKTPFLLGSRADKILNNARGAILCMVDSPK